ncbi:uncharacterized protein J3R85_011984 [Psidium guajava]|nr:uncharacterized protein J3R85_011984 [Psidium guajava]
MEEQVQRTSHASGGGGVISLCPPQLSDVDDFMVWATDPDVARFYYTSCEMPWPSSPSLSSPTLTTEPSALTADRSRLGDAERGASDTCQGELGCVLGSGY